MELFTPGMYKGKKFSRNCFTEDYTIIIQMPLLKHVIQIK